MNDVGSPERGTIPHIKQIIIFCKRKKLRKRKKLKDIERKKRELSSSHGKFFWKVRGGFLPEEDSQKKLQRQHKEFLTDSSSQKRHEIQRIIIFNLHGFYSF
jgi:hypothetical protein